MKGPIRSTRTAARRAPLLLSLAPLIFSGCGDDNGGGPYAYAGAPCRNDFDCPPVSYCVDEFGGVCLPACRDDLDCVPNDHCKNTNRHGAGGKALVCVPR